MTKVLRWGNCVGIKIPARLARSVGLEKGMDVELRREKRCLVIEPPDLAPTLEQLLSGVTAENQHADFEWYPALERRRGAR